MRCEERPPLMCYNMYIEEPVSLEMLNETS